jgi:signal transduction histidine kinase
MRAAGRGGDGAIVVLALAAAVELVASGRPPWVAALAGTWLLPLLARRRLPLVAPSLTVLVLGASVLVAGDQLHRIGAPVFASITASVVLGAGLARRQQRPARVWLTTAVLLATSLAAVLSLSPHPVEEFGLVLLLLVVSFVAGWTLPRRLEEARRARDRADRTEQVHERSARTAIADERAAIARELHDIVAHGVNVMTVQAAAARTLVPTDHDRARIAIDAVATAGTSAVVDLRRLCNVLGGVDDPLHPPPCLADLELLVRRFREAGLQLQLIHDELPLGMPAGVEATAYRIVQEALTNTLKHAGRTTACVTIRADQEQLRISVVDAGAPAASGSGGPRQGREARPGAGQGLAGMRERVALYRGTLTAGPRGRGYEVVASLPVGTP